MTHGHRTRGGLIIDDQRIPTYTRALLSANPLLAPLYPYVAAPYATASGPSHPLGLSHADALHDSTLRLVPAHKAPHHVRPLSRNPDFQGPESNTPFL
jgi:hypothetical protein